MKTLTQVSIIIALLLVLTGINAQAQSISFVSADSTVQTITCDEAANECQVAITVTFKKGTTLLSDAVKARDLKMGPASISVDGSESIQIERSSEGYLLTTPTDSLASTRLSDIKKALTKALRGE